MQKLKNKVVSALYLFSLTCSTLAHAGNELSYPQESHLKNMKQLTFGGDNAEAYWSFSGRELVFQSNNKNWDAKCDQIFSLNVDANESELKTSNRISTGQGRTTCSYFMPDDQRIIYASTHLGGSDCPVEPDHSAGAYVWAIYDSYDIFVANRKGEVLEQLTNTPGYDAEATVSPLRDKIVFTSTRGGDLDLWIMDIDGTNQKQLTYGLGYDGGAFFSPDGKRILFRASRPETEVEKDKYKKLLLQGLVEPTNMEIYLMDIDGTNLKKVTSLGRANWAPFFHPDGKRILFSSNHHSNKGRIFNIFMINEDGTGLEQVTYDTVFDAFPMFSPDGKRLSFSSNRNNGGSRDTNVFIAEWAE
ncbi:MAG: PD40 domain-containing protein [Xanthomonadaceae bacterium]|nr:PD40 domain-containing protein [Xanthomonadaceae bacterium]